MSIFAFGCAITCTYVNVVVAAIDTSGVIRKVTSFISMQLSHACLSTKNNGGVVCVFLGSLVDHLV